MLKPLAVAVAGLLLATAACAPATARPVRAAPAPAASATSVRSAASGTDAHLTIGDGQVIVHVPAHHTGIGVVVLHSLGNSDREPVIQGWSTVSDREGFVGIYPGRGDSWNAGLCCGAAQLADRDDVTWLTTVIDRTRAAYDLKTIYLAGFSNGGMMVERLVAQRPTLTACFAVWGSAPEMPTAGRWSGRGFLYDGKLDIIVPPTGGHISIGGTATLIRPALATGLWLRGAHLKYIEVPGYGHAPTSDWPQLGWDDFKTCA